MCGYLFYILGYNPKLYYFIDQIVPALAFGGSLKLASMCFGYTLQSCGFVLLLDTSRLSILYFYLTSALNQPFIQKHQVSPSLSVSFLPSIFNLL